jgi:hypothetical protein
MIIMEKEPAADKDNDYKKQRTSHGSVPSALSAYQEQNRPW